MSRLACQCMLSYVTRQSDGDGEWAASAAQFAVYIPQVSP